MAAMRPLARMWPGLEQMLVLALQAPTALGYSYGTINHDADPYVIAMRNNVSTGPDGPWWHIAQAIDYPDQYVSMLPSISQSSLSVNASACQSQSAACPLPLPEMWTISGAYQVTNGPLTQSGLQDGAAWDRDYAALLNLQGSGRHYLDRMTLHRNSDYEDYVFMDGHAMGISANYTVRYSAEAEYTMNAGFFSLNGAQDTLDYDAANGTSVGGQLTLPQTYEVGAAPSISYGLHMGSVEPNVTGSLVLGGYDSSRCLTDPIVSSVDTVQLRSIALNVSSGGHAYLDSDEAFIPDLLRVDGSTANSLSVHPRPGVPLLYLPEDTCEAIASHLPVTYSSELELYLWDTDNQAFEDIVSSPHHLDFTFSSDNGDDKMISVPFALLNLTLTTPLVSTATQYFPCKPWTTEVTGYTLGNAFLQSAFLAQNWQTNKLFLAQAPGPDFLSASIQKIGHEDETITPARNPPSWQDSWSSTLKELRTRQGNSSSPSTNGSKSDDSSSISGGAIAGIVIGAIAGLAIVGGLVWFFWRRRKPRGSRDSVSQAPFSPVPQYQPYEGGVPHLGKPALAPHEVPAEGAQVSEMWAGHDVAELPAKEPDKGRV